MKQMEDVEIYCKTCEIFDLIITYKSVIKNI